MVERRALQEILKKRGRLGHGARVGVRMQKRAWLAMKGGLGLRRLLKAIRIQR